MLSVQIINQDLLVAFWLVFSRFLSVMFQLPIFDSLPIPGIVKILTTLLFSFAFFPYVEKSVLADIAFIGEYAFWVLTIFNVVVGLIIGYFVKSLMSIFIASGSLITQQVGFGAIRYFDPSSGNQIGSFENIIKWTILVMIVFSGALIPMFKGILISFNSIHIYDFGKMGKAHIFFIDMFKSIFLSSLLLSSPLIMVNLFINSILGVFARTVPQMNVIMMSFVVNIVLGVFVFITTSNEYFQVGFKIYTEELGKLFQFLS